MDIKEFSMKLIKRVAMERNKFFTFEKQGDFFMHTSLTKEFAKRLEISESQVVRKDLFEIYSNTEALTRRNFYMNAWEGQEIFYQVEHSLNSQCPFYIVLSPVFLNEKVVSVIGHGAPAMFVPIQLKESLKAVI